MVRAEDFTDGALRAPILLAEELMPDRAAMVAGAEEQRDLPPPTSFQVR